MGGTPLPYWWIASTDRDQKLSILTFVGVMAEIAAPERRKRVLIGAYFGSLQDSEGKARYLEKLSMLDGFDPYESEKSQWHDDIDLWPSITHIHLAMYLLYTPSQYTGDDLLNYKSLDCSLNFVSGWVREVMVKVFN